MTCFIVPDDVLKHAEDKYSLKLSKDVKSPRNRVKQFFNALFGEDKLQSVRERERHTHDMQYAESPLPGKLVLDEKSPLTGKDLAIDFAHRHAGIVYDFYFQKFGRSSLDDKGLTLVSSCHFGQEYNNAYWNGQQMAYGDGDGELFIEFSRALDVVGHELTHGVVSNTCNLYYYYQPGALNESLADVFGVTIKQWALGQNVMEADWLVGADIVGPVFKDKYQGKAIRTFKKEKAYIRDSQPKHMDDFVWTMQDNGGVHINSGIPNHAYYLVCMKMGGCSYEKPIKIWYGAMLRIKSHSGFKTFAKATLAEARKLHGEKSPEAQIVIDAWKEVGINIH